MSSYSAPRDPFRRPFGSGRTRPRVLIPTIAILVLLVVAFGLFTTFWTDRLWYTSLGFTEVFTTKLVTRISLFVVFGLAMGLAIGLNLALAHRLRPRYRPTSPEQQVLDRYRDAIEPHRRLIASIVAIVIALFAGSSAAGRWSQFLQWWNRTPFGTTDPQFGLDTSFYVFGYPWYRFLLGFGFVLVFLALVVAAVAHYLYGGIRLQSPGQKASAAAQAHVSVLVGFFILLKAVAYWFDRYGLLLNSHQLSEQEFTGMTYTDAHAMLPAKTILAFIAVVCAFLFFANLVRRTWLLPGIGLGLLLLAAIILSWLWPAIVQQFQVRPNEPDREAPYIERNINATREAYNIKDVKITPYTAETETTAGQLAEDAETIPGIRLMDPSIIGQTFEQLQQVRGFYQFPDVLDVDRYNIGHQEQDSVVAVREISLAGLPDDQRNWNNDHTVFTHGYGFVAAYGNRRAEDGAPVFSAGGIPATGALAKSVGKYQPRIYYGEESPPYSIVGEEDKGKQIEFDRPTKPGAQGTEDASNYTYDGKGGVPIGSYFHRMLYAAKFQDGNIMLSGRINGASRILYDRSPRERVQKVAPWLTVDGDTYPAIVDGRIKWIVDGYTMSKNYPYSQRKGFEDATSDTLTNTRSAIARQQSRQVNYMRNSVKAVVDAYDGSVTLYAWDKSDPILQTWMKAFPGTVQPKSKMPKGLLAHIRYPLDMFKVQREILTQYHVTDPKTFYQGTERWKVPSDPNQKGNKQPPYYLSVRMPGQKDPDFSLTSTYIYFNRENLAGFMAVDANAQSSDYGTMRVLALSNENQIDGPNQIANKIGSNSELAKRLRPLQRTDTRIENGNLLTLPVGDGLLYVQPVYVERKQSSAYPLLRLVVASFGGRIGVGDTLQEALDKIFEGNAGASTNETVGQGGNEGDQGQGKQEKGEQGKQNGGGGPSSNNPEVRKALKEANQAFQDADAALKKGNLEKYAKSVRQAHEAVERAAKASTQGGSGQGGSSKGGSSKGGAGER